MGKPLHSGSK